MNLLSPLHNSYFSTMMAMYKARDLFAPSARPAPSGPIPRRWTCAFPANGSSSKPASPIIGIAALRLWILSRGWSAIRSSPRTPVVRGVAGAICYKLFMRRIDLFLGFFKLGALAFGGTGPLTRAIVVDDRRWLDDSEFAALLGLCQALPGANTCNFAVMLGDRFCGASGAVAALAGLLAAPLAILVAVASFFTRFAHHSDVRAALFGATAAAAGLAIGTAVKMTMKVRLGAVSAALALAAFLGSAVFRAPLPLLLVALVPASFLFAGRRA